MSHQGAVMANPGREHQSRVRTKASATSATDLREVVAGVGGNIRFNAPLSEYTSFKIGGPADVLVAPNRIDDLSRLVVQARAAKVPIFMVGGTNLLIRDGGIRGVVVSLSKFKAITDEPNGVVYSEGGVIMPALLQHAIARSLSGLEWAAGIPGTVAGCVVMNAGTRLGEMKDSVKAVRMIDPQGHVREYPASEVPFSYRRAHLPEGIVVGVWMQLRPGDRAAIQAAVKDYLRYRKATQPLTMPNAGCAFKNPETDTAGRLIEAAGLKGLRVGDAQVSERHANFVVNLGNARATDVIELVEKVRRTVKEKTGVVLELELKIVGEP